MCRMCEGFSVEDTLALDAAMIAEYGFMVQGVGSPPGEAPGATWAYTVGLLDHAGHPELVVAGPKVETAGRLLNALGRAVIEGECFAPGETVRLGADLARIGAVHPIQLDLGTFATWDGLKARGVLRAPALEVLQVFAPPSWFCEYHRAAQPVLADPDARVDAIPPPPNRATRRARRR